MIESMNNVSMFFHNSVCLESELLSSECLTVWCLAFAPYLNTPENRRDTMPKSKIKVTDERFGQLWMDAHTKGLTRQSVVVAICKDNGLSTDKESKDFARVSSKISGLKKQIEAEIAKRTNNKDYELPELKSTRGRTKKERTTKEVDNLVSLFTVPDADAPEVSGD